MTSKVPTQDSNLYKAGGCYGDLLMQGLWWRPCQRSFPKQENVMNCSERKTKYNYKSLDQCNVFTCQHLTPFLNNNCNTSSICPCPWSLPITADHLPQSAINLNWAHNCLSSMGFSPCRPQIYTLLPIPSNDVESISFESSSEKFERITSLKRAKA